MNILALAEYFPSPYKPYHNTQFEQFVMAGHALTVAAFHSHEDGIGADAEEAPFVRHVRDLPGTLCDLFHRLPSLVASVLKRPAAIVRLATRAANWPASPKQRLLNMSREMLLPAEAPVPGEGAFVDPAERSDGRLGEEKGFLYGLQAFQLLLDQGAQNMILRVVGDGPQASQLRQLGTQGRAA